MAGVFISYVREDQAIVDRLIRDLRARGVKLWVDRENIRPGERWADSIRRGIAEGEFFLACFSESYLGRGKTYMNEELTVAIEELRQRATDTTWFIPLRLSDSQIPNRQIGAGETLRSLQRVDLFEDWEDGLARILSVVRPQEDPIVVQQASFAILAHQVLGPLQGIRARADYLRRSLAQERSRGGPRGRIATALREIEAEASLAGAQLQAFQALTQVLQEEPRIFRSELDLAEEAHRAISLLGPSAHHRGVAIRLERPESRPRLRADRQLLGVLLLAIIDNAVKYSRDKSDVLLGIRAEPHRVRLTVRNRGVPVAREDVDAIFELGFRTKQAAAVAPVGSGRGLYLAKRITTAHGGSISFSSHQGGVNTLTIDLPRDEMG